MLSTFLTSELFAFLLVFCRVGSALMVLPGFSESYVAPRLRLMLALLMCFLLAPVVPRLPAVPAGVPALVSVIVFEITIGLFIGSISRMLISAIHVAGYIIAYQSGLSAAVTVGLGQLQGQDTALGNLLSFTTVVLLFATNCHHLMLGGLAGSYNIFLPGQMPIVGDIAEHVSRTVSGTFATAMQLAAPSLVVGALMNLGAGMLSRLMPNFQIFFLMMAPQLLISFMVLMATFSAIMLWNIDHFKTGLSFFMAPAG
jgi:flagellar biosynthetic protein FliR